jgi:hypothetical protein
MAVAGIAQWLVICYQRNMESRMARRWEDMTADEKADQLREENQRVHRGLATAIDELRKDVKAIEKKLGVS